MARRSVGHVQAAASGGGSGSGGSGSGGSGIGSRVAEQLVDNAEESVEQLEKRVWSKQTQAHLGPAPASEGEEATVLYFAYGSNINKKVFEGRRMIKPADSWPATLPGWQMTFSQPGLPYREPAFAAVERLPAAATDGDAAAPGSGSQQRPVVHGVVHRITPTQWRYVLETEGATEEDKEDRGYAVVRATAVAYDGRKLPGVVTLTVPAKTKARLQGREALPSLRYLKLIREGAADYGLAPEYREWLDSLQHYEAVQPGQKLGAVVFAIIAFTGIFPVWAGVRLLRRLTGMKSANGDMASRFMGRYTAFMFGVIMHLHELLRPVLGCGMTAISSSGSSSGGGR